MSIVLLILSLDCIRGLPLPHAPDPVADDVRVGATEEEERKVSPQRQQRIPHAPDGIRWSPPWHASRTPVSRLRGAEGRRSGQWTSKVFLGHLHHCCGPSGGRLDRACCSSAFQNSVTERRNLAVMEI